MNKSNLRESFAKLEARLEPACMWELSLHASVELIADLGTFPSPTSQSLSVVFTTDSITNPMTHHMAQEH